jgi:hypothetical protein
MLMFTAAIALVTLAQGIPENPSFDYSGMPTLAAPQTRVVTHSVTVELTDKAANVTSTTVFRTESTSGTAISILVPRMRLGDNRSGQPTFAVSATWDKTPVSLGTYTSRGISREVVQGKIWEYRNDLVGKAQMKAQGTHALRVSYTVPFGRAGVDRKMHVAGYYFTPSSTIGQMNITFRYGGKTVFRLPQVRPDWAWQVGDKGAFIRQESFSPTGQLAYVTFYPGGFENIGGSVKP